jgi:hypothetical protein
MFSILISEMTVLAKRRVVSVMMGSLCRALHETVLVANVLFAIERLLTSHLLPLHCDSKKPCARMLPKSGAAKNQNQVYQQQQHRPKMKIIIMIITARKRLVVHTILLQKLHCQPALALPCRRLDEELLVQILNAHQCHHRWRIMKLAPEHTAATRISTGRQHQQRLIDRSVMTRMIMIVSMINVLLDKAFSLAEAAQRAIRIDVNTGTVAIVTRTILGTTTMARVHRRMNRIIIIVVVTMAPLPFVRWHDSCPSIHWWIQLQFHWISYRRKIATCIFAIFYHPVHPFPSTAPRHEP